MTESKRKSPRVLLWDIETSHNVVAVFKLFGEDYINHENLLSERYVVCACWKWLGEDKVHHVSVLGDPKRYGKNPHDDKHVVETLHKVLSSADVIVAHNGDAFDLRFVKTRMLANGLKPLPPITSIDTLKTAKSQFMFNSNRLDYIGKLLGIGRKMKTEPGLWLRVLAGEKKAVRDMVTYNRQDVLLLEEVFKKLAPYMPNHINRELFGGVGCPRCGSTHVQSRGTHKAITKVYSRFQCQECGGWFRELKGQAKSTKFRVL